MGEVIQEDTRNRVGKHELKNDYFASQGVSVVRSKLAVGDYSLPPAVSIDTKMDISELANDICHQHERFKRELLLARDMGTKLIILTENRDGVTDLQTLRWWDNPRAWENKRKGMKPPVDGQRLSKACETMEQKYGVKFMFCTPEEAGRRVIEILRGGGA